MCKKTSKQKNLRKKKQKQKNKFLTIILFSADFVLRFGNFQYGFNNNAF